MEFSHPTIIYLLVVAAVSLPVHAAVRQYWVCTTLIGAVSAIVAMVVVVAAALASGRHVNFGFVPMLLFLFGAMAMPVAMLVGIPFAVWRLGNHRRVCRVREANQIGRMRSRL